MKLEIEKFDAVQFKVGDIILAKQASCTVGSLYWICGSEDKLGVILVNLKDPENTYKLDCLSSINRLFNYNLGWLVEKFTGKVTLLAE